VCQQLGVPVKAGWKACSLSLPPFAPSWETMEVIWQDDKLMIKEKLSGNCSLDSSTPDLAEQKNPSLSEKLTGDVVLV
jgi:hypothetical protein